MHPSQKIPKFCCVRSWYSFASTTFANIEKSLEPERSRPYTDLDVPLNLKKTKGCDFFFRHDFFFFLLSFSFSFSFSFSCLFCFCLHFNFRKVYVSITQLRNKFRSRISSIESQNQTHLPDISDQSRFWLAA